MSDGDQIWWTLGQVIGWVRATYPDATVWDVRAGLEGRCASGRIQARGRRRIYSFDRFPKISHTDPGFVTFSEEYSYVNPLPEPIRPGEWRDLAFFARPIQRPGEDYRQVLSGRSINRTCPSNCARSQNIGWPGWTSNFCEKMWCANGLMTGSGRSLSRLIRKLQALLPTVSRPGQPRQGDPQGAQPQYRTGNFGHGISSACVS